VFASAEASHESCSFFFFGRKEYISFNDSLKARDYTCVEKLPTIGVKYRIIAKSNKYIF